MPVRFVRECNFLRIILEGVIKLEDLYAGVDAIYVGEPPRAVLWDMLNAEPDPEADAASELRQFSEYAAEKGKDRRDSRVALLAPPGLQYGLSRMTTAYAQQNNAAYTMQPFQDEEQAMAWLASDD